MTFYDTIGKGYSHTRKMEMGVWDREYGQLRHQKQYDLGYRFIYTTQPNNARFADGQKLLLWLQRLSAAVQYSCYPNRIA